LKKLAWLLFVSVMSSVSVGCAQRQADEGASSALEEDMEPLRRGELPSRSKLRLEAKAVSDGWNSTNARNGDGRISTGKFALSGQPNDTQLIMSAQRLLEEYTAEQEIELAGPIDGWAQSNLQTLDGQVEDVSKKIAVDAFAQEDKDENVSPVRSQVGSVITLLGAPEDVGIVHSQSYAKVEGSPDGKLRHLTLTLFVNLKTGEFAGFYAREGWM
jgi:hypothetical protein